MATERVPGLKRRAKRMCQFAGVFVVVLLGLWDTSRICAGNGAPPTGEADAISPTNREPPDTSSPSATLESGLPREQLPVLEPQGIEFPDAVVYDSCEECVSANGTQIPLLAYWNRGLHLTSGDERFDLHVGGNLQWDSVWLIGPNSLLGAGNNSTSTSNAGASLIRRGRVKFDGNIYRHFDYSVEFDLSNAVNDNKGQQNPTQDNVAGSPFPCNVWAQLRDVPWFGRVRVGNQVKPIGMTNNTYQGFLPFMERADNMDGFYGPFDEGFDPGISAINWTSSERIAWRYGIFRPLKNAFGIGINEYSIIGRITALPVYGDNGRRLVHVGLGASQGSLVQDEFRIRARPVLRNGPGYAVPIVTDTGEVPATSQFIISPELAAVLGSWTFQAEWTGQLFDEVAFPSTAAEETAFFHGGYIQLLYFLTGEYQAYDRREGVFGRVVPVRSVEPGRGECGAWQAGIRFSYLDVVDGPIDGGQVHDMTFGLNWFLNSNMKVQGNYILERREGPTADPSGWFSGLGVRVAADF